MDESNTLKAHEENLTIENLTSQYLPLSQGTIKSIIKETLYCLKVTGHWSMGVVFLSDHQIKTLNNKYLKINSPTDVLAFNYGFDRADIAISLETAKRNAKIYRTSYKSELILYIIHGLLHIFGYDDTTVSKRERMFKKQKEVFFRITKKKAAKAIGQAGQE